MKRLWVARIAGGLAVAKVVALSAYLLVIRPWHLRWGATDAEVHQSLPGDDFVKRPRYVSTHAVTIRAPAAAVWPWLVQMGQGRGGLYSYDWLENLVGCDIHSADRIIPEFQHLEVGDTVRLVPEDSSFPLAFDIAVIEPARALVLRSPGDPDANMAAGFPDATWAFVLSKLDERSTRLIIRFRSDYKPSVSGALFNQYLLEPIAFVMERKMLLGIRQRAEVAAERHGEQPGLEPPPEDTVEGEFGEVQRVVRRPPA